MPESSEGVAIAYGDDRGGRKIDAGYCVGALLVLAVEQAARVARANGESSCQSLDMMELPTWSIS